MSGRIGALAMALVALQACKSKPDTHDTPSASVPSAVTASASASTTAIAIAIAPASASVTATTSASTSVMVTASNTDIVAPIAGGDTVRLPNGRMAPTDSCPSGYAGPIAADNACHKTCASPLDCLSGNCAVVQSLHVCVHAQTVGVPAPKGGTDCPRGWAPSVSEANKCDKSCTTDAQCGPGNRCKAVGPIGSDKQCQKG